MEMKWTSVKDELPKNESAVLIALDGSKECSPWWISRRGMQTVFGYFDRHFYDEQWGDKVDLACITHWMYLPDPPAGGNDE